MSSDIPLLIERLIAFRDAREWRQFHSLKDLIASVGIEAGELLELTQWTKDDVLEDKATDPHFRDRLSEEMADVFIYLLLIGERTGIDLIDAANRKIDINARKYPVEKSRANAKKYTEL
ncbi:nucleotide pyrophosphohydrolase [Varunaivibrio sulfuroxidans]|uniref:NTP pyrophosphatase (Non-canonical NTP hydrolase) n=1 Tax=Varunaivibrio sulfuroxidans TaxID=1773489 RepID=A0A4R3J4U5_9PROT|nr:nucleotide pyrophosphohydrolase [Varunaivibrio sulfuroxidans]TCS60305.1 NTP pyrophosphatase (non-canonical NTP hydrolase) [Varunaivibrio sulfuroxidans]WES31009.1 nucleotide pyrophosphohydrolase [Varunaivibrio sulfuroxidans]